MTRKILGEEFRDRIYIYIASSILDARKKSVRNGEKVVLRGGLLGHSPTICVRDTEYKKAGASVACSLVWTVGYCSNYLHKAY